MARLARRQARKPESPLPSVLLDSSDAGRRKLDRFDPAIRSRRSSSWAESRREGQIAQFELTRPGATLTGARQAR